jgi:acyl-CoA synthetase (AMP-forming)/AMP-acid ligase II
MGWEPIRKAGRGRGGFNLAARHLIGPSEVESVLMEHPAVAEAGVIGKPDPVAGELVKAFVSLKPGNEPAEALHRELTAAPSAQAAPSPDGHSPDAAHHTELLRQMVLIRRFGEKCVELYSGGEIHGFVYLYIGKEAVRDSRVAFLAGR